MTKLSALVLALLCVAFVAIPSSRDMTTYEYEFLWVDQTQGVNSWGGMMNTRLNTIARKFKAVEDDDAAHTAIMDAMYNTVEEVLQEKMNEMGQEGWRYAGQLQIHAGAVGRVVAKTHEDIPRRTYRWPDRLVVVMERSSGDVEPSVARRARAAEPVGVPMVWTSASSRSYHREDCILLGDDPKSKLERQAVRAGFKRCTRCKPGDKPAPERSEEETSLDAEVWVNDSGDRVYHTYPGCLPVG